MSGANTTRLREIVAQSDTVLFVGAGVAAWSGLPTWPSLIAELAAFLDSRGSSSHLVRRELEQGDLLQAASFAFDVLTPQDRADFLRQACRHGSAAPSPLHERLATLGPRCFITTNYDKLLEQALAADRAETPFQVVNNTNLVETASLIQSRSRDFVFKPHGDVDASDSVVLTREQYRTLRDEKHYAFDALKTLLASRPVLFVGFGLRDPDFLLIKDTLATIYRGAVQDHYALVADVDEQELAYWRNHYGIHLSSYATREAADPNERHANLLPLLDSIASDDGAAARPALDPTREDESSTLAILRHARRMLQLEPTPSVETLPLRGSVFNRRGANTLLLETRMPFLHGNAVAGLRDNGEQLLLTGAPGAGKTFVVRAAVAELAQKVIADALEEPSPELDDERVPAYLDLRDYAGDLWTMVVESFPVGFPLERLVDDGRIAFFVDGLNEVPARIVEDNSLHAELIAFRERIGRCSAVFVTRFGEEHTDLELPEIALEAIPREYVRAQVERHATSATATSEALLTLLERPVFYRLCVELGLWDARTPQEIYTAVLERLSERCQERFGAPLDLAAIFGRVAFESIDAGDQLISVETLVAGMVDVSGDDLEPHELINWLLSEGMLIPRLGGNVSLFHHSVTEYIAAKHLIDRYRDDRGELRRRLQGRRWDHVVLLAIGFLEPEEQQPFFDEVMTIDAILGVRALAFVDHEWQHWTAQAIRHMSSLRLSWEDEFDLIEELEGMRVAAEHEPVLLELSDQSESLGGTALAKTLELGGAKRIRHAIDALFETPSDYDRCTAIAAGLRDIIGPAELDYMIGRLTELPLDDSVLQGMARGEEPHSVSGLIGATSIALVSLDLDGLRRQLGPLSETPPLVRKAVLDRLEAYGSADAIRIVGELLQSDPVQATVSLHFQLAHRSDEPEIDCLEPAVAGPILLDVEDIRGDGWALDTVLLLAERSSAWRQWACDRAAEQPPGMLGAMLWHAGQRPDRFFETLDLLREMGTDWHDEPLGVLNMTSLDWRGHEELLLALLKERNPDLARRLIGTIHGWVQGDVINPSSFDLGDVGWWIDWLAEHAEDDHLVIMPLARFVVAAASADDVRALLELFANGAEDQREALAYHVLGRIGDLRLEQLAPATVEWAIDNLREQHDFEVVEGSVLATIATEELVERSLLPALEEADDPLRINLVAVIRQAGERHRRRYLTTDGEIIRPFQSSHEPS
jgi:hypothetical protein